MFGLWQIWCMMRSSHLLGSIPKRTLSVGALVPESAWEAVPRF